MSGNDDFKNNIRELRDVLGLSDVEFSDKLGTTGGAVRMWESGDATPSAELVGKILGLVRDTFYPDYDSRHRLLKDKIKAIREKVRDEVEHPPGSIRMWEAGKEITTDDCIKDLVSLAIEKDINISPDFLLRDKDEK